MKIIKTKIELSDWVAQARNEGHCITLVPTMGALHEGHLSLIHIGQKTGGITVCSIFVNPTQFNDPEDLKKYPRPLEKDIALLEEAGCDLLFLPEVAEMYPEDEAVWAIDLGALDEVWEGAKRPGHYQGVTQIVYKLFEAVKPDYSVFGQKDLQQYLVIEELIRQKELPIELVMAPTIREPEGLAMSSRNVRLSPSGKTQALALSQVLFHTETLLRAGHDSHQARELALSRLEASPGVSLEYFAICERRTLSEATEDTPLDQLVILVAAWVEGVRLIDNVVMK